MNRLFLASFFCFSLMPLYAMNHSMELVVLNDAYESDDSFEYDDSFLKQCDNHSQMRYQQDLKELFYKDVLDAQDEKGELLAYLYFHQLKRLEMKTDFTFERAHNFMFEYADFKIPTYVAIKNLHACIFTLAFTLRDPRLAEDAVDSELFKAYEIISKDAEAQKRMTELADEINSLLREFQQEELSSATDKVTHN